MKRVSLIFTLIFISFASFAQRQIIDKVISHVGGEIVLLSEVEEQYAYIKTQKGVLPEGARCQVLDQILSQKLLVNQAKLDSVEVSDIEVEAQMDARIEQILAYMNGDVTQFEEYYGQPISEVKEAFREDLKSQLLAERMQGHIISDISVTPSEVKDFFNRIPKDSLPYFDSEVEVGEIVYKPLVNEKEKQIAIEKLEELRRQIVEDSVDFALLAQKHSDDFGSGRIGGDLGWTKRGKFVPAFEAAAYKLDINEISPIVESEFGYHIIQLLERRGNTIHTRHILVKPQITEDDFALAKTKLDSIRNLLSVDSISFSFAVKAFSDKDVQSYNNDGRIMNPVTGNTFFEIADLDPDIYFTVDTMEVGKYSAPFTYKNQMGETYFRIIQLQSRTPPHLANLRSDYSKIQAATVEEKKAQFVNDWVLDKVYSTYIRIDGMYEGCPNLEKWIKEEVRP